MQFKMNIVLHDLPCESSQLTTLYNILQLTLSLSGKLFWVNALLSWRKTESQCRAAGVTSSVIYERFVSIFRWIIEVKPRHHIHDRTESRNHMFTYGRVSWLLNMQQAKQHYMHQIQISDGLGTHFLKSTHVYNVFDDLGSVLQNWWNKTLLQQEEH